MVSHGSDWISRSCLLLQGFQMGHLLEHGKEKRNMGFAYLHLRHPVLTFGLLALIWLDDIVVVVILVGSGRTSVRGALRSAVPSFSSGMEDAYWS